MGTYSITITLTDSGGASSAYNFYVLVVNNPPIFSSSRATSLNVNLGSTSTFTLPAYSDPDGNSLTFSTYQSGLSTLPSFITLSANKYTFTPVLIGSVGTYTIVA